MAGVPHPGARCDLRRPCRRAGAPRLAAAATVLLVIGYLSLAWLTVGDAFLLYGVRHHLSQTVLIGMYNGVHPAAEVAEGLFVLGHVLGTILLGIGMLRGRVVPTWAAVATIVAQPIHFVAAVIVGSHALDLLGWGLNAVGFAALSVRRTATERRRMGPLPSATWEPMRPSPDLQATAGDPISRAISADPAAVRGPLHQPRSGPPQPGAGGLWRRLALPGRPPTVGAPLVTTSKRRVIASPRAPLPPQARMVNVLQEAGSP